MMEIKKNNLNYILILLLYVLLNIILCIITYNNFSYIFIICDLLIANKIFYLLLLTILIIIISLFYLIINNFYDRKMINSSLIIMTILILIFFILSIYLRLKVDISKSSEIFYNSFLDLKIIKIIWSQEELMTIYKYHSIQKNYILSEETILGIIAETKNPEQLIEKLNSIYNKLIETTILDKVLNFICNHKYKILIGTGLTISIIVGGVYVTPILISKFAVAPIIEAVQENPIIEIGVQENPIIEIRPQENITAEVLRTLYEDRTEDLNDAFKNIEILNNTIDKLAAVLLHFPGIVRNYIKVTARLHSNIFLETSYQITSPMSKSIIQISLDSLKEEAQNATVLEETILKLFGG